MGEKQLAPGAEKQIPQYPCSFDVEVKRLLITPEPHFKHIGGLTELYIINVLPQPMIQVGEHHVEIQIKRSVYCIVQPTVQEVVRSTSTERPAKRDDPFLLVYCRQRYVAWKLSGQLYKKFQRQTL